MRLRLVLVAASFVIGGCSQEAGHATAGATTNGTQSWTHTAGDVVDLTAEVSPRLLRRFQPLPRSFETTPTESNDAEVKLGRQLFFETRLSKSDQISCNSCHGLTTFGVDNAKTSTGHGGKLGRRNAPTVYNAAGSFVQFWDGRAPNVEEQAKGPILNPIEMAMPDADAVVHELKNIPGYFEPFKAAFPADSDPITFDNVGRAIGAFERGLVTPGRWDKFLEGDKSQLTAAEKTGLKTFLNAGCMVCHTGPLLGGSMFERVGVVEPWPNQTDTGRMEVTKAASDSMRFKVPTLRNIEKTAPYFHDGSAATLEDAVQMMGKHQHGLELSDAEIASIVTWLKSLTGEIPASYIAEPELPK
ncbi:MAG: cytochrome c peroxidase [Polyangiaceae bacterium]